MEILAMKRTMGFLLIILTMIFVCPCAYGEEAGRVYCDLGVFAYEDGDYEGAERNFKKALNLDRENPSYNHYLGKTYLGKNDLKGGEEYLKKAWGLNPRAPGLKYDMGLLAYRQEKYREAVDALSQVASEEPSNVLAQYYAGICFHRLEQHAEAIRHLLAASDKSPTIKANLLATIAFSRPSSLLKSPFESSVSFTFQVVTAQALLSKNVIRRVNGRLIFPGLNQFENLDVLGKVLQCLPHFGGNDHPFSVFYVLNV